MYRNSYLEIYKNSTNYQPPLTLLLNHFAQLHATMGCVLQDLQFQIGKIQLEKTPHPKFPPDLQPFLKYQPNKSNYNAQKQVVKVEEEPQNKDINDRSPTFQEEPFKKVHPQPRIEIKVDDNSVSNKRKNKVKQHEAKPIEQAEPSRYTAPKAVSKRDESPEDKERKRHSCPEPEKVRGRVRGNDSFESLFDAFTERNRQEGKIEIQYPRDKNHRDQNKPEELPQINQVSQEHSQEDSRREARSKESRKVEGTYDDFLSRIFKEGESRRSNK